jgi:hypothetical protein
VTGPGTHNRTCRTRAGTSFILMHRGAGTKASSTFFFVSLYRRESWISLVSDGDGASPNSVLDSSMCELLMMAGPRVLGLSCADRTQFKGFVRESNRKIHVYMVKPRRVSRGTTRRDATHGPMTRRTDPLWVFRVNLVARPL